MSCIKTLKPPPFQNLLFSFPTMFEKPRKTTLSAYLMRDGNINLKSLLQSLLKQTLTFFYTTKWLESVTSSPKAPIHPRDRLMVYRTVRQNTDYFFNGESLQVKTVYEPEIHRVNFYVKDPKTKETHHLILLLSTDKLIFMMKVIQGITTYWKIILTSQIPSLTLNCRVL